MTKIYGKAIIKATPTIKKRYVVIGIIVLVIALGLLAALLRILIGL